MNKIILGALLCCMVFSCDKEEQTAINKAEVQTNSTTEAKFGGFSKQIEIEFICQENLGFKFSWDFFFELEMQDSDTLWYLNDINPGTPAGFGELPYTAHLIPTQVKFLLESGQLMTEVEFGFQMIHNSTPPPFSIERGMRTSENYIEKLTYLGIGDSSVFYQEGNYTDLGNWMSYKRKIRIITNQQEFHFEFLGEPQINYSDNFVFEGESIITEKTNFSVNTSIDYIENPESIFSGSF
ncbi:MAG: hypothetical protein GQ574_28285 [Crocinitomix sp.]|nr:hypothetical protein [Crocinitomix sp.]